MKNGFTMIELVFVIVVIGILAGIAIPKLTVTRDDAQLVKAKSTVSNIQSGLATQRAKRVMRGQSQYPGALDDADNDDAGEELFEEVLTTPVISSNDKGGWIKDNNSTYTLHAPGGDLEFDYNSTGGSFMCDTDDDTCKNYFAK